MNMAVARRTAAALILSIAGVSFIQQWEGTEQTAYLDSVGVPTICTGSTRNVFIGQKATLAECEKRLVEDTTYAGKAIARCTTAKLTQQQYDALVSFAFNVGGSAYCSSTMARKINNGDCFGAAKEFPRWSYAKGKKLRGLERRRIAEMNVFLTGCQREAV